MSKLIWVVIIIALLIIGVFFFFNTENENDDPANADTTEPSEATIDGSQTVPTTTLDTSDDVFNEMDDALNSLE